MRKRQLEVHALTRVVVRGQGKREHDSLPQIMTTIGDNLP